MGSGLIVKDLVSGYGSRKVLDQINLNVNSGEVIAVLGRNGSGKSTLFNAIMSIIPLWGGEVSFDDQDLSGKKPESVSKSGINFMPQGARIFPELSIYENLILNSKSHRISLNEIPEKIETLLKDDAPKLLDVARRRFFPNLKGIGGMLSGGERQVLCIIRTLLNESKLILIDEPTIGLSPILMDELKALLHAHIQSNLSVLFVEQKVKWALNWCDRVYILQKGKVVYDGSPELLINNENALMNHLGIGHEH